MTELWPFLALGAAAICYIAGILFALRGERTPAAMLIVVGAMLTMVGAG
ncbi:MAG: hypothetical protein AAGM38_09520 [Pseudomonadota bacterium]